MTNQMRQRLIGLLVIIAIFAIFLPILFHNPNPASQFKLPRSMPPLPGTSNKPTLELPAKPRAAISALTPQTAPVKSFKLTNANLLPTKPTAAKLAPIKPIKAKSVVHVRAKVKAAKPKAKATQPVTRLAAMPEAWVVQIASFNDHKHAATLAGQLRKEGLEAYTRSAHLNGKLIVRVFVGPKIQYKNIKLLQQRIKKRYHLNGLIVKYHV
ncbi:MAG: SPOR domain-containing protein [Gammaproteobacteria bacterium]|nr:SPOR domain-containing protein [Gammaproteobacteria bacterium]MCH9744194.1 SPOR domain-containing protein [Gammaproteobacteria bacterium]